MSPLDSVAAWCDGVGHGPGRAPLYAALVVEETAELLDEVKVHGLWNDDLRVIAASRLQQLSAGMRTTGASITHKAEALDAALDVAWVALCLAYQLTGCDAGRLQAAWAELHRSNVDDKQRDGKFDVDASGKVRKPDGWRPPNFERLVE